jgi:starch phosphorylase
MANPELADLVTDAIGDEWIEDFSHIQALRRLADDAAFRERYVTAKRGAKLRFADWLCRTTGTTVDPDTIFDSQIKRIHEYKRQLLNILHVIIMYNRMRRHPEREVTPRTFFFAGKAAPAYHFAKLIIRLINNVAGTIDGDPAVRGRLKVLFLPDYNVSLAERLIPASDVSEQISTAGYEASGTSNMKFMMNGALTMGTRDGATIEIARAVGDEHIFLFGLTAQQVADSRAWYDPHWHYTHDPETRDALDLIFTDYFSRNEPGIFAPIRTRLLDEGDYYMHLADLGSYAAAQARVDATYADAHTWARSSILNVASSGRFSSDRTIGEYAADIWHVTPSPVA